MANQTIIDPEAALEEEFRERWIQKKIDAGTLAEVYKCMGYTGRSIRVQDCGSWLEFAGPADFSEKPKLHFANFCRDRLCPMCCWRRSLKVFGQVSQVMDLIGKQYRFLFCSFTMRSCSGEELHKVVDRMQKSWKPFMKDPSIRKAFKGYFRALEITRHPENKKEFEYHPHFHIIFAVNPSYFTDSKIYISQRRMTYIWKEAAKLNYKPIVDMRICRPDKDAESGNQDPEISMKEAVAEAAKYSVKSADYLRGDLPVIQEAVAVFLRSLESRRLCSYGGIFAKARKQLQLDDETNGDLIHTDPDEKIRTDIEQIVYHYQWQIGLGYVLSAVGPLVTEESCREINRRG